MIKVLLTDPYIRLIKLARELNENKKISGNLYFHPRESDNDVIVKTIDLARINPLCEVNSKPAGNQNWKERWVEAWLINEAKKNDWQISLAGKKCKFLSSQFTFRENPDLEIDGKQHRHVDLLLYNKESKHLVVLELKSKASASSLEEAKEELRIYVKEVRRLLKNEQTKDGKNAFCEAFDLETVKDVIGYVVYPRTEKESPIKEKDFRNYEPFGLMEYIEPWKNNFDEVKKSGRDMIMNFTCPKPAG
jgi:hypothetical protein